MIPPSLSECSSSDISSDTSWRAGHSGCHQSSLGGRNGHEMSFGGNDSCAGSVTNEVASSGHIGCHEMSLGGHDGHEMSSGSHKICSVPTSDDLDVEAELGDFLFDAFDDFEQQVTDLESLCM
jgi:hypothetical protein